MPKSRYKKRADGRYLAQIPTGEYQENGKPKLKNLYARTQAELDAKVAEFRRQAEMGRIIDDKNITVEQYGIDWFKAYKSGLEYNTKEMYLNALNAHIFPVFGPSRMRDVRKRHIMEFINSKVSARNEDGGPKYSRQTVGIILLTLRQVFAAAEEEGVIAADPAKNAKLSNKVERPRKEKRALTEQEDRLFLQWINTHDDGLFFSTIYHTGMRPEEARALTLPKLDFVNDEIIIDEACAFESGRPVIKGCKTHNSIRRVPMPAPLKAELQVYRPKNGIILFPGASGGLMGKKEYESKYRALDAALNKMAGGTETIRATDPFTPYILRHNYATIMAEANVPIKYLSEIMGSSPQTLMKYYIHASDRNRRINKDRIKNWDIRLNIAATSSAHAKPDDMTWEQYANHLLQIFFSGGMDYQPAGGRIFRS